MQPPDPSPYLSQAEQGPRETWERSPRHRTASPRLPLLHQDLWRGAGREQSQRFFFLISQWSLRHGQVRDPLLQLRGAWGAPDGLRENQSKDRPHILRPCITVDLAASGQKDPSVSERFTASQLEARWPPLPCTLTQRAGVPLRHQFQSWLLYFPSSFLITA